MIKLKKRKGDRFIGYDLNLAKRYIQGALDTNYSGLNFEYEIKDNCLTVAASLTLNGHDDGVRMVFNVYEGGMASFRAVFDKIEKLDVVVLTLLNDFNRAYSFLKAFVRGDGFLEISNGMAFYDEKMLGKYTCEFMSRVSDLSKDETLKRLTSLTK